MLESAIEEYRVAEEPYYLAVNREIDLFEAAHAAHLPVILKGPTGCGKTRFVEHMAWRLERALITVACHEDLSATDLVGRFLLEGEETIWHDGPLTAAVRNGAEGSGLLRTEFLFLDRVSPPDEAEQLEKYQQIARAMEGRPLTIRRSAAMDPWCPPADRRKTGET